MDSVEIEILRPWKQYRVGKRWKVTPGVATELIRRGIARRAPQLDAPPKAEPKPDPKKNGRK